MDGFSALPLLLLLGIGLLFAGGDDSDETSSDTLSDSGSSDDDQGQLPTVSPQTFLRFDDDDNFAPLGEGSQVAFGEAGDDEIEGGDGDDEIFLYDGNDKSFLDADDDNLPDNPVSGALGDDLIRGGDGEDILIDGEGSNEVFGDLKADFIDVTENDPQATNAADTAYGGFGSDTLVGDDGDILYGGQNKDAFFVEFDTASDDPVTIADYEVNETITLQIPADATVTDASAELNESGTGVNVMLNDQIVMVVEGLTNVDALNLVVEASL